MAPSNQSPIVADYSGIALILEEILTELALCRSELVKASQAALSMLDAIEALRKKVRSLDIII
jgi:hypothetical protein